MNIEQFMESLTSEQKHFLVQDLGHTVNTETGWRLPSVKEMLAMYDVEDHATLALITKYSAYWTSTRDIRGSYDAWAVGDQQTIMAYYERHPINSAIYVRSCEDGLEVAPYLGEQVTQQEATKTADNLHVNKDDIVKLTLNVKTLTYE